MYERKRSEHQVRGGGGRERQKERQGTNIKWERDGRRSVLSKT